MLKLNPLLGFWAATSEGVIVPPPFDPFGPVQWLKADAITGLVDGNNLGTWQDSSAFNNDGAAAGAVVPIYHTNILNTLPAIRIAGTATTTSQIALTISNSTPTSAAEMFIVLKKDSDPSPSVPISGCWNFCGDGVTTLAHYPYIDGSVYDSFATNARKSLGNPAQNLSQWHIYNVHSTVNDWAAYINGNLQYSTNVNTFNFAFSGGAVLGISNQVSTPISAPPNMAGYIAEYILWDKILTSLQRSAVLAYLQSKYLL